MSRRHLALSVHHQRPEAVTAACDFIRGIDGHGITCWLGAPAFDVVSAQIGELHAAACIQGHLQATRQIETPLLQHVVAAAVTRIPDHDPALHAERTLGTTLSGR